MNLNWMQARRTKYTAYVAVYILIILAVIVGANYLSSDFYKTADVTSNKRYSLSEQTANIVKGLKQDAVITYVDQGTNFRRANDILDQYKSLSGKIHLDYVDADKNPKAARAAMAAANLQQMPYGTTLVQIGTHAEEAKSLDETGITGAIIRVLKGNVRTVCFMSGAGEAQIDDTTPYGLSRFKDVLTTENYQTKSVSWLDKAELPKDCTVLVIAGPTKDYVQGEVDAIRNFVENGGRALFMLYPPLVSGRNSVAENAALAGVLQNWGVTVNKNVVLDAIGLRLNLGLEVAVVLKAGYGTHPIVTDMKSVESIFPESRSLDIKNGEKTTVEKLFTNSAASRASTNMSNPDPDDPKNTPGPFTLGAAGSYDTGKKAAPDSKENIKGRFVVVGSGSWVINGSIRLMGNSDLAANMINWLASDEDIMGIQPKEEDVRGVSLSTDMKLVIWVSQALLPLAVVVCGILVWVRRSRSGTMRVA